MGKPNPIVWDCGSKGCFNLFCRPKIEQLADFLPRDTAFTDVDGIHEVDGRFLLLEWKSGTEDSIPDPIREGQARTYRALGKRLGRDDFLLLCVAGSAKDMDVSWMALGAAGNVYRWRRASFDDLCRIIRAYTCDRESAADLVDSFQKEHV